MKNTSQLLLAAPILALGRNDVTELAVEADSQSCKFVADARARGEADLERP